MNEASNGSEPPADPDPSREIRTRASTDSARRRSHGRHPVVVMSRLNGSPLRGQQVEPVQIKAMAETVAAMHTAIPPHVLLIPEHSTNPTNPPGTAERQSNRPLLAALPEVAKVWTPQRPSVAELAAGGGAGCQSPAAHGSRWSAATRTSPGWTCSAAAAGCCHPRAASHGGSRGDHRGLPAEGLSRHGG